MRRRVAALTLLVLCGTVFLGLLWGVHGQRRRSKIRVLPSEIQFIPDTKIPLERVLLLEEDLLNDPPTFSILAPLDVYRVFVRAYLATWAGVGRTDCFVTPNSDDAACTWNDPLTPEVMDVVFVARKTSGRGENGEIILRIVELYWHDAGLTREWRDGFLQAGILAFGEKLFCDVLREDLKKIFCTADSPLQQILRKDSI